MADKTMSNAINFENNELWKRFLAIAQEEIPTEGTLKAMMEKAIQTGTLHLYAIDRAWISLVGRLTAQRPWQYFESLRKKEHLSLRDIANELGVSRAELTPLKQCRILLSRKSLDVFCRNFCSSYPQYPRGKLMRLLKRAIHQSELS